MNSTTVRLFLLGTGKIATRHADALKDLPSGAEGQILAADPNPAAREKFQRKYPQAQIFESAESLLSLPATPDDIAVVAAPPFVHKSLAVAALESGRHTLCEKPLAMNRSEAEEMLATAKRMGRLLGCCSTRFVMTPATQEARRIIDSGVLGDLYHVTWLDRRLRKRSGIEHQPESPWFVDKSRSGGGCLMDWGPYDFSSMHYLLQPTLVDVLSAWTASPVAGGMPQGVPCNVEFHVGASIRLMRENGQSIHVTYERSACIHGEERKTMEIEGTQGALSWTWPFAWKEPHFVTRRWDVNGAPQSESVELPGACDFPVQSVPLVEFFKRIHGLPTATSIVDEQAVFNFAVLRALYDVAESGQAQSVSLSDFS